MNRATFLRRPIALAVVLMATAGCAGAATAPALVIDAPLPVTPAQHQAWPLTQLDENTYSGEVSLTRDLIELGFPDPRGLPYQQVVLNGPTAGTDQRLRARGWIIPRAYSGGQRFAVCWDGVIRPVVEIKGPADPLVDARNLLESERWASRATWFGDAEPSLPPAPLSPTAVAMLTRLGHFEIAHELWQKAQEHHPEWVDSFEDMLAWGRMDWTEPMMMQAATAHRQRHDRLCLSALERIGPAYERFAAEQPDRIEFLDALDLWHLELYPVLLADQRRRLAENRRAAPPTQFLADQQARIAQLIAELDQVHSNDAHSDWIISALVAEGEAAVGPLIRTVRNDRRLTRRVMVEYGKVRNDAMSVADVAVAAIGRILEVHSWRSHGVEIGVDAERRAEAAAALARFWERYEHVPPRMRWYLMLADDEGGRSYWTQAARKLVEPEDQPMPTYHTENWITEPIDAAARGDAARPGALGQ